MSCQSGAPTPEPGSPAKVTTSATVEIRGSVVSETGEPVVGARVAAYDMNRAKEDPTIIATTDNAGRFSAQLTPSKYGLSAVADDHTGGFVCGVDVAADGGLTSAVITMQGEANLVSGRVENEHGRALGDVDVLVVGWDGTCSQFVVRSSADGRFRAEIPLAKGVTVTAIGTHSSEAAMHRAAELGLFAPTVVVRAYPTAEKTAAPQAVLEWVRQHSVPIKSPEPTTGTEDLAPLREVVGDARIVSLGEATHGTREFFQLKHRMLKWLVTELGFTAFVIEATMPEAFLVNDYVVNGRGDARKALANLYFWVWNTEEVLALIEWMRAYNADPSHKRKIRFYGNDIQYPVMAASVALKYLARIDPTAAKTLTKELDAVLDEFVADNFGHLPRARRASAQKAAKKLLARLESASAGQKRPSEALALATQHARILAQFADVEIDRAGAFEARDQAMAANTAWALEREGTDGKIVVWAHNSHVRRTRVMGLANMGSHLHNAFGEGHRVFGFAFSRGRFQAEDMGAKMPPLLREFEVGPLHEGSLSQMLSRAGSLYALDLRNVPQSGPVADWFRPLREARSTGSAYADEWDSTRTVRVQDNYDALFFVDRTTAARPNHPRHDVNLTSLEAPQNLSFEGSETLGAPTGWHTGRWIEDRGYRAVLESGAAQSGDKAVRIERNGKRRYGIRPAEITQRVKSSAYAGKTVTLTFHAKARGDAPVYVYARETRSGAEGFQVRRVDSSEWKAFELSVAVPAAANGDIVFGLAVTGESTGWIDAVTIGHAP